MPDNLITSRQNPRIKNVARLRDRRGRERQWRFVIDGVREISRAFQAGVRLEEVFFCPALCQREDCRRLIAAVESGGVPLWQVTPEVFEKIAFGQRSEGVLAVAQQPQRQLTDLNLPARALVVVLEGLEKPGNLGAVLRTADATGVAAVVVAGDGVDLYNPNAIRASLGTIFSVPVCQASTPEVLAWLRSRRLPMFATRVEGTVSYNAADFREGAAFIFGSEATGLSDAWTADDITPIALPMLGVTDSLNVSATAAAVLYEAVRQRSTPPAK